MTGQAAERRATHALLRLRCRDAAEAERLRLSLAADDDGHASLRVEGAVLVVEARSGTALGLLRTLDDVLGCLRAAEPGL